ncbi:MAG: hypothetical protein PHG16_03940 [Lachnospiraceae bacterium]|nr:hypothetical protein [Lachnospiraceae bacterium]
MKELLKMEYHRLLRSKILYIALGINILIILMQIFSEIVPYAEGTMKIVVYPLTLFEKWIGGENSSVYPTMYFMLAPLISAIPYGGSLQEDLKTGYIKNICTRGRKKDYLAAKYIVTFSTGLISVIPLVLNFLITAVILPATLPQASTLFYSVKAISMLGETFYTQPYLYLFIWLVLDILFFGFIATISLVIVFFSEYVYVAILAPFLACMALYGISLISSQAAAAAPFYFLRPSQPYPANPMILALEAVLLVAMGVGYYYAGNKKEIY